MGAKMSLPTRKKLLAHVQERYRQANWDDKGKILDELIATTGYRRKYAINLLNQGKIEIATRRNKKRQNKKSITKQYGKHY